MKALCFSSRIKNIYFFHFHVAVLSNSYRLYHLTERNVTESSYS